MSKTGVIQLGTDFMYSILDSLHKRQNAKSRIEVKRYTCITPSWTSVYSDQSLS